MDETGKPSEWLPGSWHTPPAPEPGQDSSGPDSVPHVAPISNDAADTAVLSSGPSGQSGAVQQDTAVLADPLTPWPPPPSAWPSDDDSIANPYPAGGAAGAPEQGGKGRVAGLIAAGTLTALLAGATGGFVGYQIASQNDAGVIAAPTTGDTQASPPAEGSIAAIAAAVTPAVVNITSTSTGQSGTGSGFIISSDGYIVTNNHVIDGSNKITVKFADGSTAGADLVGSDAGYDLAVLKVSRTGLPVVALGSSDAVLVGDTAIAVGSPLGLSGTVTSGIISALNRPVTAGGQSDASFINAIQTDAAINPGNSGGPLLNADGEVIGVNSAIASLGGSLGGTSGSIGLGFAIPIDTAKRIVDEIIADGSAQTPIIGVQIEDAADGPQVVEVNPGGPAEAAGIQPGDVITEVDGRPVDDSTELIVAIRDNAVGDTITLTVERNGTEQEVEVTLTASEAQ